MWPGMESMGEVPMAGGWGLSVLWLPVAAPALWRTSARPASGAAPRPAALRWVGYLVSDGQLGRVGHVGRRGHVGAIGGAGLLRQVARLMRSLPAAAGYGAVWAVAGALLYPVAAALAQGLLLWPAAARAMPALGAVAVAAAGALQFSGWKRRHLAACRAESLPNAGAFAYGWRLGLHCVRSCAGLTVVLLVLGVMDWRAMALVAGAIAAERWSEDGAWAARVAGYVLVCLGAVLMLRVAGAAIPT